MLNSHPPLQPSDVQVLPDPARRWLEKPAGASWWPASEAQAKALDCPADILLMGGSLGSLKDLALTTPIPTPSGWTTMGEIAVGDVVFDERGKPCSVTGISPIFFGNKLYDVRFDDGTVIRAGADHQWLTMSHKERMAALHRTDAWRAARRARRPRRGLGLSPWTVTRNEASRKVGDEIIIGSVRTTEEIAATQREGATRNHSIAVAGPLQLPERVDLPLHPYILGVWLGDGTASCGNVTIGQQDKHDLCFQLQMCGAQIYPQKDPISYRIEGLHRAMRLAGLKNNKHIPPAYLRASTDQRMALLQGLMDTDGTANPTKGCVFYNTNLRLINDVRELLLSLGVKANIASWTAKVNGKECGPAYGISFVAPFPAFRIARKLENQITPRRATNGRRYIDTVTPVATEPTRCITVDSASSLYLCSETFIPTHNTSTMLVDLIQERDSPTMRAYFFRRTYSEMEGGDGAIDQSQRLFRDAVTQLMLQTGAKATYNGSLHTWTWPSGAEFYFRHAQHEKDIYQYQGHAMSALGIDEVTHWPEKMVKYLVTRNRCTDPNMTVRVRFGTNPGNVGNKWCKHVFFGGVCPHCNPGKAPQAGLPRFDATWLDGQPLSITLESGHTVKLSVAYILSSVREHNMYPPEYLARIKMQSPATAKALLEGCWDIFEGQFFDVFEPDRGIRLENPRPGTGPMVMPRREIGEQWWWPRWLASDFGFSISVSAAHLLIHQPQSQEWPRGRVFIADELDCQETAKNFAQLLLNRWVLDGDGKPIEQRWMPWYLSPDSFREIGIGFTLAAQMNEVLRPYGVQFQKADNDRVGGAMKMYTGFETGELVICAECPKLIAAIQSRVHDDKNENDVKKISGEPDDDYYDSCIAEGSLVATERGDVPIERVSAGDRVWTRAGLRTVNWAGLTGENKPTVELQTKAGRSLCLTPDHVIWADQTWKSVDRANYGDYLETWPTEKKSSLTARPTGDTLITKTTASVITSAVTKSSPRSIRFIETRGKALMGLSRKGWWFTTKTATALTTSWQTLSLGMPLSICAITTQYGGPSSQRLHGGISQRHSLGTAPRLAKRGIERLPSPTIKLDFFTTEHPGSSPAKTALASFMRWLLERIASVRMLATRRSGENLASMTYPAFARCAQRVFKQVASSHPEPVADHVERVVESKMTNVYNLSVESDPEFFANGILVHNCRYGYKSWETARGVSTPLNVRLAERLGKEFNNDPTTAMFNAMKMVEQEKAKEQPAFYGGSVRARIQQAERNRKRGT